MFTSRNVMCMSLTNSFAALSTTCQVPFSSIIFDVRQSSLWPKPPKLHTQINSAISGIQKYAFLILNVPLNNVYLEIMMVTLNRKCRRACLYHKM